MLCSPEGAVPEYESYKHLVSENDENGNVQVTDLMDLANEEFRERDELLKKVFCELECRVEITLY